MVARSRRGPVVPFVLLFAALVACGQSAGPVLPLGSSPIETIRGEPRSGQLSLRLSGDLRGNDRLELAETNGFSLSEDDPPDGFLSVEWDGTSFGASVEGASATGPHDDMSVSILTEVDGDVYDFTTDEARNIGRCIVTIERSDAEAVVGRFECHALAGSPHPVGSTPRATPRPDLMVDAAGEFRTSSAG